MTSSNYTAYVHSVAASNRIEGMGIVRKQVVRGGILYDQGIAVRVRTCCSV